MIKNGNFVSRLKIKVLSRVLRVKLWIWALCIMPDLSKYPTQYVNHRLLICFLILDSKLTVNVSFQVNNRN